MFLTVTHSSFHLLGVTGLLSRVSRSLVCWFACWFPFSQPTKVKQHIERRPLEERIQKCSVAKTLEQKYDYSMANPAKWSFSSKFFAGDYSYNKIGHREVVHGLVAQGIAKLKREPNRYMAIWYENTMLNAQEGDQKYTLLRRAGTQGFTPLGCTSLSHNATRIGFSIVVAEYKRLPSMAEVATEFSTSKDAYTDGFSYAGAQLHHGDNPALVPGRGMGVADVPSLKIIGDVDPSDIAQGAVGDCWLLSAISALAEFDGAVKRLFRNTPGQLEDLPNDKPNQYVVTLFDLKTWEPVDITVDERLAAKADGTGLLGMSWPTATVNSLFALRIQNDRCWVV